MEELDKSNLINVLQNSELAEQFSENDKLVIPKQYIFDNIKPIISYKIVINNGNDFAQTMEKLRFWMVKKLPFEIYDYITKDNRKIHKMNINFLMDNFKDFFYKEVLLLNKYYPDANLLLERATWRGLTNLTKYIYKRHPEVSLTRKHLCKSLNRGILDCVKYCHENRISEKHFVCNKCGKTKGCCTTGNMYSDDQLFQKVYNHKNFKELIYFLIDNGYDINQNGGSHGVAAFYGVNVLRFIHENGANLSLSHPCIDAMINEKKQGRLEVLKYLESVGYKNWSPNAVYFASTNGHLDCLKFFVKKGVKGNFKRCLKYARQNDHKEIVSYLEGIIDK